MIDAIGKLDNETSLLIDLLCEAVDRFHAGGFPDGFRWDDVPQHCGAGPGRSNTMLRREEEARQISHTHAWWVRQRDHLFHALDDWRGAIGRVSDLIPRITKWTDDPREPAISRWSARFTHELGLLLGVRGREEGPMPLLEKDKVPRLQAALSNLLRMGEDLRNIVVTPAQTLSVEQALLALETRDDWTLEDLPAGISDDLLLVLDADGHILLQGRCMQNNQRYPGGPVNWSERPTTDWISPIKLPGMIGTWEVIFKDRDNCKDLSPRVKLSGAARAELARLRLRAAAPSLSEAPTPPADSLRTVVPMSPPRRWTWQEAQRRARRHLKTKPFPGVNELGRAIGGCPPGTLDLMFKKDPWLAKQRNEYLKSRAKGTVRGGTQGDAIEAFEGDADRQLSVAERTAARPSASGPSRCGRPRR